MYFKRKSNVIYRNYDSFGYITDNRNFGYKLLQNEKKNIGDKILSETGNVFFSVLDNRPQPFDILVEGIEKQFIDVDNNIIKNDAIEFYYLLEQEGFIVSGSTPNECEQKDIRFSYKRNKINATKQNQYSVVEHPNENTQDFFEKVFNGKPQLTNLHLEITSKCNERCIHCYIPHENKLNHIEPNLFYDILEQCSNLKLLHLTISGGEPMLHNNFCDFLSKCREYNFSVNVLTNLTLLNDKTIAEMKANPILGVQTSLYSMDPTIHDGITQMKGSFEKTRNAILRLVENNIPLQISCPIMKQNKESYNDVVKWASMYNINVSDDFVIIGGYNHTTKNLNCRLSLDEVEKIIKNKAEKDTRYLEQIAIEAEKKKQYSTDDYVCSVCNSSICITEKGDVYPCAGWQGYIVGNVKTNSLSNIWDNSDKVKYLRNLRKHDFPKCIQCSVKEYCTMCMIRNANESPTGNPLDVNKYFCEIAKINKEILFDWRKNN